MRPIKLKKVYKFKCWECGKYFYPRNRPDGLPNGAGFRLSNGGIINVCTDCIMKKGEDAEDGKDN